MTNIISKKFEIKKKLILCYICFFTIIFIIFQPLDSNAIDIDINPKRIDYNDCKPNLPSSKETDNFSNKIIAGIEKLSSKINKNTNEINNVLFNGLNEETSELNKLYTDMNQELDDLKKGLYCSRCNRSKTIIEKSGTDFYQHVKDVKGEVLSASPERIKNKKNEYRKQNRFFK